jgi:hypothetical protein
MAVASIFDQTVYGRIPKSTNMAVADNWTNDGVGRPDVHLTTLKWLSLIPGAPDIYARSVLTGLLKMGTLGGLGLWWIWDIVQLWSESDRVLKYGMSTPFGHWGIAQGMITDKKSVYKTGASYSLWLIGIIFGFMGIDSLVASNGGQFLRKLVEFILFAACVGTIISVWSTGITFGWICAVIFGSFLASIIIAEYISVISVVFGGNIFKEGIQFTNKQDKQYNGFFSWLIKNTSFSDERKAQIVKDLQYGGIPADEIVKMFKIFHPTEIKTEQKQEESKEEGSSSWVSFFLLMASPVLIMWNGIMYVVKMVADEAVVFTPWGAAMKSALILADKASETAIRVAEAGAKASAITNKVSGLTDKVSGLTDTVSSGLTDKVSGLTDTVSSGLTDKVSGLTDTASVKAAAALPAMPKLELPTLPTLPAGLIDKAPTKVRFAPKQVRQSGGGQEPLSAESQIFGAVTVALISGGVIKSLVDYLIAE